MYQMVRVVRVPTRVDAVWIAAKRVRGPQIGETGCVADICFEPQEMYCVESVLPDGRAKWLADFFPDELVAM
jgi:hypothetical protein